MPDRLITVAIHTYEKALTLRTLLESEGIKVSLQNVNLTRPVVSSGVRIRIKERDLPHALRIIENGDCLEPLTGKLNIPPRNGHGTILVPVDCTPDSLKATEVAFRLASLMDAKIKLLHSFMAPPLRIPNLLDNSAEIETEISAMEEFSTSEIIGHRSMDRFEKQIHELISKGEIPSVEFDSLIEEGIPEEIINMTARELKPLFIVMATRGSEKKERDMIGSVTAEVLDICRSTILSLPSGSNLNELILKNQPIHAVYFGNMDQSDMLALDNFYRLFSELNIKISLIPIPSTKAIAASSEKASEALLYYCRTHFNSFKWEVVRPSTNNVIDNISTILKETNPDMLAMPNKKRNVFARFFNPTLPHRLLYSTNLPMTVIPV